MSPRVLLFLLLLPFLLPTRVTWVGAQDLTGVKIFLDPGHGGEDPGVIGPTGVKEKEVVLDIAQHLKQLLVRKLGVKVFLTRWGDYYLTPSQRVSLANNRGANLFLSLHTSASFDQELEGFRLYYLEDPMQATDDHPPPMLPWLQGHKEFISASKHLARLLLNSLNKAFRTSASHNRIVRGPWICLLGTRMPAVMVEVGYLTNPQEVERLSDRIYRQAIAEALALGIEEYCYQQGLLGD